MHTMTQRLWKLIEGLCLYYNIKFVFVLKCASEKSFFLKSIELQFVKECVCEGV